MACSISEPENPFVASTSASRSKLRRVERAFQQMNLQNVAAILRQRQIHEKDFVETPFAHQFRRQAHDVVGGGDDENRLFAFGHPGQKGAQHAARQTVVVFLHGHALFDFVHPQHARRHDFGGFKGLAQIAFGFAVVFVVQHAEIEPQQAARRKSRRPPWRRGFCRNPARPATARRAAGRGCGRCVVQEKVLAHVEPVAAAVACRRFPRICVVSYSKDRTLSRSSNSYFARMTSGISDSEITPSSLMAL